MLVKCKLCGKSIDKATAYRVATVVNKRDGTQELKYMNCCSEAEWIAEENRKNKYKAGRDKVYFLICDMFGYEIQNSQFFDEWRKWNKLQSDEMIYKYIRDNEEFLQQVCDKTFDNEYKKIRYFSAILKNSLRDLKPCGVFAEKPAAEKPKVVVEETIYEAPTRTLNKRRSLEDLEDMF